ncbi:VanZ family protein [Ureibacillus sp. GCM10028918]|uniref:VanZ family protein n=1 Tax=Ureibacillus sp. GCM10028918 TaxID=3273429 RepID=UPI0036142AF1
MKLVNVIFGISFVLYLLAMIILLFLGQRGYIWVDVTLLDYIKKSSNFVPFKTISTYIQAIIGSSMNMDIPIKNLVGNLFMFLPIGIYLPFFINRINKISTFNIFMIILLFFIEAIQLVTRRGSFDIDDFILNMLGALIGFRIWNTNIVQKLLK